MTDKTLRGVFGEEQKIITHRYHMHMVATESTYCTCVKLDLSVTVCMKSKCLSGPDVADEMRWKHLWDLQHHMQAISLDMASSDEHPCQHNTLSHALVA